MKKVNMNNSFSIGMNVKQRIEVDVYKPFYGKPVVLLTIGGRDSDIEVEIDMDVARDLATDINDVITEWEKNRTKKAVAI